MTGRKLLALVLCALFILGSVSDPAYADEVLIKRWKWDYGFAFANSSEHFNTGKYTMLDRDYETMCAYLDAWGWSCYKRFVSCLN